MPRQLIGTACPMTGMVCEHSEMPPRCRQYLQARTRGNGFGADMGMDLHSACIDRGALDAQRLATDGALMDASVASHALAPQAEQANSAPELEGSGADLSAGLFRDYERVRVR
jgi:hypothetical protein